MADIRPSSRENLTTTQRI